MATYIGAVTTTSAFDSVATRLKDLWAQIFTILRKLLGTPVGFIKKFRIGKQIDPPLTEVGTLPELPQDVLMHIFATLEIPDLLRAGSVCSSWHSAYVCMRSLGLYKQSQTPLLFYIPKSAGKNIGCLYSLLENRTYKLTLPEPPISSRFPIGSSNGWLITADESSEMHLVNPITGEQVALPSVITIEHVKPITDGSGVIHKYELLRYSGNKYFGESSLYAPNTLRERLYYKAFVFPDPCTRSYVVVLIHHPCFQLSFARAGDDKWTWLPPNVHYRDCAYVDGLLYALTSFGQIDAFELTTSTVTRKVILDRIQRYMIGWRTWYIILAPWGDLLQVWRAFDVPGRDEGCDVWTTTEVKVYKVDLEAKELVETKTLSKHILFLGHNNSLCLSADEHPQLKENHAYFTDDRDEPVVALKEVPRDIGFINMENSCRKKFVSPIWSNWPCPTWITPHLTKMNLAFSK